MNGDSVSSDELKYLFGEVKIQKDLLRMALDPEEMLALSKLSGKDALGNRQICKRSIEYLQSEAHLGTADIRDIKICNHKTLQNTHKSVISINRIHEVTLTKGKDGSLSIRI